MLVSGREHKDRANEYCGGETRRPAASPDWQHRLAPEAEPKETFIHIAEAERQCDG